MRPRLIQMTATAMLVVGLSASAVPAFAQQNGDFEKGVAAYDAEDYKQAADLWQPLADDGNVDALRNMAQLYRLGLGVQRDDSKAFELYLEAAQLGADEAQVNVAFQLLTGKGVDQDREEAATWFAKAADQGNPLAQYNLGLMYEKGVGVKKDEEFSMELYRLAASQGQRRAIARLDAIEASEGGTEVAAAKAEAEAAKAAKAAADAKAEAEAEAAEMAAAKAEAEAEAEAAERAAEKARAAKKAVEDAKRAAAEKAAAEKAEAEAIKAAELAKAEAEAEAEAAKNASAASPLEFEDLTKDAGADTRPVVNVVRTPMRKPGEKVAGAPKGDEPTPIFLDEDGDVKEAPKPSYTMRVQADHDKANKAEADAASDDKSASTSSARAPSDPVARVRFAETAYKEGRFSDAVEALSPLANAGMPIAQFWMGRMYNRGEGVDLNRAEAYSLWRSAAAGGSERAATALANLASRLSSEEIAIAEQKHAASGRAR